MDNQQFYQSIYRHKNSMKEFLAFCQTIGFSVNPKTVVNIRFSFLLGIFLEFCALKGLMIDIGKAGFSIYPLDQTEAQKKAFLYIELEGILFVHREQYKEPMNIMSSYRRAIAYLFKYLN